VGTVVQTADQLGIDPLALLSLVYWESGGGNPTAANVTSAERSYGLYQLNLNVNPISVADAINPVTASAYWAAHYGPSGQAFWREFGGQAAFTADPITFLTHWVPAVQVSQPWQPWMAQQALAQAQAGLAAYYAGGGRG